MRIYLKRKKCCFTAKKTSLCGNVEKKVEKRALDMLCRENRQIENDNLSCFSRQSIKIWVAQHRTYYHGPAATTAVGWWFRCSYELKSVQTWSDLVIYLSENRGIFSICYQNLLFRLGCRMYTKKLYVIFHNKCTHILYT